MTEGKAFVILLSLAIICTTLGGISECHNKKWITLACIEKTGNKLCEVKE